LALRGFIGRTLGALGLVAALGWAQAAGAQTFRSTDFSGEELFQRLCSACHGALAHGDGPVAGSLNKVVPDLTRLAARRGGNFPAAEVQEIIDGRSLVIAHGTRAMPVWGYEFWVEEGADVTAEKDTREIIRRLVGYLESIQVRSSPLR
jgi:mono/diheme cytochrome c family protein